MPILILLYLVLPGVQVYFFLAGQFGNILADILNFGASIFALHWLLANVIITSKIPWLQRSIPYDARIRFHIFSTAGIGIAVIYHAIYYFAMGAFIDPPTWAIIIILTLMLLFAILWIPVPGFKAFRTWLISKKRGGSELNYDRSKGLHRLFVLVLGFLLLLHILEAEIFLNVSPVSALFYGVLYVGSFGIYLLSLSSIFNIKSEIISIEDKEGIIIITLQPTRRFRYKSGQFTFLGVKTSTNKIEEHPFSFLSSPQKKHDHKFEIEPVSLAIRALGDFTRDLSNLKPGNKVQLRGSYGNFRPGKEKALCFVASGIGTVPIISILKDLHASGDKRPMQIFLAVDHKDEIPEREKIVKIAESMPNVNLHMMVYSEDGLRYSEDYFRKHLSDQSSFSYYLCSSPGVRPIVLKALTAIGVKKSAIHSEAFTFG
ncbi:MAG: hypothetical protein PF693_00600 [Spirochaetia bacterium]|jgi:predicted ferric reductase|nr:hypothetical protein [Spirochaetia bacterium]